MWGSATKGGHQVVQLLLYGAQAGKKTEEKVDNRRKNMPCLILGRVFHSLSLPAFSIPISVAMESHVPDCFCLSFFLNVNTELR